MNTSSPRAALRRVALLSLVAAALSLAGCANQTLTRSGFLADHDTLTPSQNDAKALTYSRALPATATVARRDVVIDPIQMRLPAAQAAELAPGLLRQAEADYRVALETAFSKHYRVVAQVPAEGALRVRAAITGLKPSNPTLNAVTFLLLGPVSNGGVSTESEVVDSSTGERIAAQATFTNGHLFNGGLGGYFDKLGHVRKALDTHAEKLRELTLVDPARSAASVAQVASR